MADIKIPDDDLSLLLQQSIMLSLNEGARERLVNSAIEYLITPKTDYRGVTEKSPLELAFENALGGVAYKIAHDVFEEQGTVGKVKAKFVELLDQMPDLADDSKLQGMIFAAIMERSREMRNERY